MTVPDDDDAIMKALRAAAAEEARADEVAHADMLRLAPELAAGPDEGARQRLADRLLGAAPPLQRRVVKPRERRFSLRQLFVPLGFAIPLAAGFIFLVRPQAPAPLPGYQPEVSGYVREERGAEPAPGQPLRLLPGSVLRVNLRPDVAVEGKVVAAGFVARAVTGGPVTPLPVYISFQSSSSGAIAVTARYPDAFADAKGRQELRLLVLRPGLAPRAAELAALPQSAGPGWQRVTVPVQLGTGD